MNLHTSGNLHYDRAPEGVPSPDIIVYRQGYANNRIDVVVHTALTDGHKVSSVYAKGHAIVPQDKGPFRFVDTGYLPCNTQEQLTEALEQLSSQLPFPTHHNTTEYLKSVVGRIEEGDLRLQPR